ncbi:tyrosinase [Clonorchis sinensis]|uniref:Tyrosinase n=1 Tax=Clonorchis sinensis TaxID=79923 RepID=G7Y7E7_CLOSI|nr:tyrosinase [Clonorchis sinensis]
MSKIDELTTVCCLVLLGIVTLKTNHVTALIPEQCAHNVSRPFSTCCPTDPFNHLVCGGPERGSCQQLTIHREYVPRVFLMDDRLFWPARFFDHVCHCKDKFYGVACEQCWFGWTGPHCDQKEIRIRRNIRSLSEDELELFKDVMYRSQTWPSGFWVLDESTNNRSDPLFKPRLKPASVQYWAAFIHRYGARPTLYETEEECSRFGILNFSHDGVTFPTWHRYFQLIWERMLSNIALEVHGIHNFAVPYWDMIGLEKCDICTDDYVGGPGHIDRYGVHLSPNSAFTGFQEYCLEPEGDEVCFGCQGTKPNTTITRQFLTNAFPNQEDLYFTLNLQDYFVPGERDSEECRSFHMALEGYCGRPDTDPTYRWMHNRLHRMINGSMCCTSTATNDPIFIVLHNFVDKIFNAWLRLYHPPIEAYPRDNVRPGHSRDAFMVALMPLLRNADMFVDSLQLGYDYDNMMFGQFAQNGVPPIVVEI